MKFDIKSKRIAIGLSQRDLGEMIGVKDAAVCMWENGTRTPCIETLVKLADIFGCTVDDLIIKNRQEEHNERTANFPERGLR